MSINDAMLRVLEQSLDELGEPGAVERLLLRVAAEMKTDKVSLYSPRPGGPMSYPIYQHGLPHDFDAIYLRDMAGRDPWYDGVVARGPQLFRQGGMLSQQLMPTAQFARTPMGEQMRSYGLDAMASTFIEVDGSGNSFYILCLMNEAGRGDFSDSQFRFLRAVTPWVRRVVHAQRRMDALRRQVEDAQAAVEQMPIGLVQVDADGRLSHANLLARQCLGLDDPWHPWAGGGGGSPGHGMEQRPWLCSVHAGLHQLWLGSQLQRDPVACRLTSAADQRAWVALARRAPASPGRDAAVHIVLTREKAAVDPASLLTVLATLYGLTPAESALIALLLQGMAPREMAEAQGVRLSTVRTHLSHLFQKTGSRGQVDLVQALSRTMNLLT